VSATSSVIEFVLSSSINTFPEKVLSEGRRCVTDGIGVILAGSTEECAHIVQEQIAAQGGTEEATIFGLSGARAPASLAARANGTAGHAMDFDDTQLSNLPDRIFGLLTHPTVAPLSAGLAVAERENISGELFLEAFLTGVEVECKIAEAMNPRHYMEGFHSTATAGTLGATVTTAKLMRIGPDELAMALGIAASLAAGIRLGFGTMTKPFHAGRAAENGILAVDLASRGFTAGHDALEAPWGFFRVFGGGFDENLLVGALGNPFTLLDPGVSVKPFPSGSLGHPSMAALLDLLTEYDLQPGDIERITFRAGHNILNPLRYFEPTNELEAKFCIPFVLSSIVLRRRAGIHEFRDEFIQSEEVQEMMSRVSVQFDEEIDARGYDRMRSALDVQLRDGTVHTTEADIYPGGPERPLTREELHGKFRDCASLVMEDSQIDEVLAQIENVDDLPEINDLVTGLSPSQADPTASI
tara:strand:+ start:613 stop:2022 length:1410 start_codon:yes stop_codon:yes gene_type:complete